MFKLIIFTAFSCSVFGLSRKQLRQEPDDSEPEPVIRSVEYTAKPPLPDDDQLGQDIENRANYAFEWWTDSYVADAAAKASEMMEQVHKSNKNIIDDKIKSLRVEARLNSNERQIEIANKKAERYAIMTRDIVAQVEPVTKAATQRAVNEVVAEAMERLGKDATKVKEKVLKQEKMLREKAVKAGEEGAKPYLDAKKIASENIMKYLKKAQELADVVSKLKTKSMTLATEALPFQAEGKVVEAQKRMIEAHDIMGKALQYEGQAKGMDKTANTLNNEMGLYDLAAGGAKSYYSYRADPAGSALGPSNIAPLPKGIHYN